MGIGIGIGIFVALVGFAVWLFVRVSRAHDNRREELKARGMQHQPWGSDRDGGRGIR